MTEDSLYNSVNLIDEGDLELNLDELKFLTSLASATANREKISSNDESSFEIAYDDSFAPDSEEEEQMDLSTSTTMLSKVGVILKISVPVMTSFCLFLGSGFIIMFFAGHLSTASQDTTIFAGISMATMFANVSWFSLVSGMTTALETLGSQNNGAKNYRLVGIILQRSIVVIGCFIPLVLIIWFYAAEIFQLMGTDKAICDVMVIYLRIRVWTMPLDVVSRSYSKYLLCLGLSRPDMYSQIVGIICTACLGGISVHYLHAGVEGLVWAQVISAYLASIFLVIFSWREPAVQRTLQPLSLEAFDNMKEFFALGIPGLAMLCAEVKHL